jgi:cytoskeletal protein CcmA (bactofilin family)
MKEKDTHIDSGKITGFFDKNTEIEGTLKFNGSFQIDGQFNGKIDSSAVLIIGKNGKVESQINIGVIIVIGEVKGDIRAKERVEIHSGGRVIGTITTPNLIVKEGANLEAQCHTTETTRSSITTKPKKVTGREELDIQEKLLS